MMFVLQQYFPEISISTVLVLGHIAPIGLIPQFLSKKAEQRTIDFRVLVKSNGKATEIQHYHLARSLHKLTNITKNSNQWCYEHVLVGYPEIIRIILGVHVLVTAGRNHHN